MRIRPIRGEALLKREASFRELKGVIAKSHILRAAVKQIDKEIEAAGAEFTVYVTDLPFDPQRSRFSDREAAKYRAHLLNYYTQIGYYIEPRSILDDHIPEGRDLPLTKEGFYIAWDFAQPSIYDNQ